MRKAFAHKLLLVLLFFTWAENFLAGGCVWGVLG
jgi:hypothetical protein